MKFIVENLGPITKAEVDLSKRLILLTGQNNTGKTYLSNAVYNQAESLLINRISEILIESFDLLSYDINLEEIVEKF